MKNKKNSIQKESFIIKSILLLTILIVFIYILVNMFYSPNASSNTQEKLGDSSQWFNADNDNYLSFTPATNGTSTDIYTVAFWVKRGALGIEAEEDEWLWDSVETNIYFNGSDHLSGNLRGTEVALDNHPWSTNVVFRNPNAWYHIVAAYDSTQSINTNRFHLYVNGIEQKFSSISYMPQYREMKDTQTHFIGYEGSGYNFDGHFDDFYMVDGQQLTPYAFGEIGDSGEWMPKKYDGKYGVNGFYLDFDRSELENKKYTDSSPNQNSIIINR